jgi:hypothetical protein
MSDDVARRNNGQFAKGQSGNTAGARTRKREQLMTAEDFHRTVLRVAASKTQLKVEGQLRTVTLVEVNVWGLASGKAANRLAAKDMLDLTRNSAYFMDALARREDLQDREQRRKELGY